MQYGDITFGGCVHLHSLCNWKTVLSAGHMAPWRHIADTSAVRADGSRIRRLVNCDSAMRWGNLTGHHIWTGLLVSTNLLALYWEAELSPLILSPDSVSIRVNHFHLKRINHSPSIWHFKRNQMLTRTNPL